MDVGLVAAFLGGGLALLSPCGALLLPAFFATTLGSRGRLLAHTAVFALGLSVTLVPLGLSAGALGTLLAERRGLVIAVAGWLVVAFGVMTALGLGFDLRRVLPGAAAAQTTASRRSGLTRAFLLGTASGVAGFCAGPILGAVLTMAATTTPLVGAVTLAVYGLGMVAPLLVLALVWRRLGERGRTTLRGREVRLGPVRTHTTSLVTGTVLVAVGVLFLRTNGMATLPELLPSARSADLQGTLLELGGAVPDVALVLLGAVAVLAVWAWLRWGRASSRSGDGVTGPGAADDAPRVRAEEIR